MKSGVRYVNWNKKNKKWIVKATIDGSRKYLGSFDSLEDAKNKLIENNIPIIPKNGNSKHYINSEYFKNIDTPRKAFWFGFICADGSIFRLEYSLALKIGQADNILLKQFAKDVESSKGVCKESNSNMYYFNTYDREFIKNLIYNGKTLLKSELNEIPKSVNNELRRYFIRGYFEGDGSIYLSNNNLGFQISAYDGMANDIASYIRNSINYNIGVYKDGSISSIQVLGNNRVKTIMNFLYDDVKISEYNNYPKLRKYINLLGEV